MDLDITRSIEINSDFSYEGMRRSSLYKQFCQGVYRVSFGNSLKGEMIV